MEKKRWIYVLFGIVLLFFISTLIFPQVFEKSLQPGIIKEKIEGYGIWAPVVLIAIIALFYVLSIIPLIPFIVAAGYIFGMFLGLLYSLIGTFIGITFVFVLAKRYGRPFVEKITDKTKIKKFDVFFKKWGVWALVIQRLVPLYPPNVLGFLMGLTKIKYRVFIVIYLLMTLPGLIGQNYVGQLTSYIEQVNLKIIVIAGFLVVLVVLIFVLFFKDKIKNWVLKEIKILEKDFEKIKKKRHKA